MEVSYKSALKTTRDWMNNESTELEGMSTNLSMFFRKQVEGNYLSPVHPIQDFELAQLLNSKKESLPFALSQASPVPASISNGSRAAGDCVLSPTLHSQSHKLPNIPSQEEVLALLFFCFIRGIKLRWGTYGMPN